MLVPATQGAHARMFVSARTLPRARALVRYKDGPIRSSLPRSVGKNDRSVPIRAPIRCKKWTDPQLLPPIRWKKWPIRTDPGTDPL